MNSRFAGRKALVTGGTRGIGEAVARQLLSEECSVVITGKKERIGWWSNEPNCSFIAVDFADSGMTKLFCEKIRGGSFSYLVNNGASFDVSGQDIAFDAFESIMRINVAAAQVVTNALAYSLKAGSFGRVVNIASIAAFVTRPGVAAYAASKAALIGLTRVQALEFATSNVLVNAVCPSYTETDMLMTLDEHKRSQLRAKVPLGRFCNPNEVSQLVCFLLSSDNSYITGQALVIDGGVTIQ